MRQGWVCEDCRDVVKNEEARVERNMTAREIFAAGFKVGQSQAGIRSDADAAFDDWLLMRAP